VKLKDLEKAVKADPGNVELRAELAAALADAGRDRRAIEEYQAVVAAYRHRHQPAEAAKACRAILAIDPDHDEAKHELQLLQSLPTVEEPAWQMPVELAPFARGSRLVDPPPTNPGKKMPQALIVDEEPPPSPDDDQEEADDADEEREPTDPHRKQRAVEPTVVLANKREDSRSSGAITSQLPVQKKKGPDDSLDEQTTLDVERPDAEPTDDGLELAQAFDRPFAAAVNALAPDGTTIEEPLAVFRELPDAALRELQRRISIRRVPMGTIIVREGETGDAAFVVQSGSVKILKRDPVAVGAGHIEVVRLGAGSMFGEFALLADRRRHATVQAAETTELYEIPRRVLKDLAMTYPDVGPALERLYRERLVSTLISTAPFFRPLPEEDRGPLMTRFVPVRFEDGATIIREGSPGGGLFLVVLGTVEITKHVDDQHPVLLASLGEGSYFGEMALLRKGGLASATVTAAGPVECAQLPPKDFYQMVSTYPVLWEELRREAQRRELANQFILAGDADLV
jgi:CRP-like cAMP-binding protein